MVALGNEVVIFVFLTFSKTAKLFSRVVAPFHVPVSSVPASPHPSALLTFSAVSLFPRNHYIRCIVVYHWGLNLHFPNA